MFYWLTLTCLFFPLWMHSGIHPFLFLMQPCPWHWAGTSLTTAHRSWKYMTSPHQFSAGLSSCSQGYLGTREPRQEKQYIGEQEKFPMLVRSGCWSVCWEFFVQLCAHTLLYAKAGWNRSFILTSKSDKYATELICSGVSRQWMLGDVSLVTQAYKGNRRASAKQHTKEN